MKLRSTIRPPKRYGDDECELTTHVSLRRSVTTTAAEADERLPIPFIDFVPNQRPAAFPTLDEPVPPGSNSPPAPQASSTSTSPSVSASPAAAADDDDDDDDPDHAYHELEADEDKLLGISEHYRDIAENEFDNFIASNGPQNPQYVRNMALLAREETSDLEISDHEDEHEQLPLPDADDNESIASEEKLPDDPEWNDLPLSLKLEIVENMMETYKTIPRIRILLGLNESDTKEVIGGLYRKNKDLELEDLKLQEMREKQLSALLCLDNSDLKQHRVPARLIMSKLFDQSHELIQKRTRSTLLFCRAGHLILARKFLSKKGLPLTLAGKWDNEFVATPSASESAETLESLKWKESDHSAKPTSAKPKSEDKRSQTHDTSDLQFPSYPAIHTSLDAQAPSIKNDRTTIRYTAENKAQQPSTQPSRRPPTGAHLRLRIDPRNAARIQIDRSPSPPRRDDRASSWNSVSIGSHAGSDDTIQFSPSERTLSFSEHYGPPMPVRRTLSSWSAASHPQILVPSSTLNYMGGGLTDIMQRENVTRTPNPVRSAQLGNYHMQEGLDADSTQSVNSSPPDYPTSSSHKVLVHRDLANRIPHVLPTPLASSPTPTRPKKDTINNNHFGPIKSFNTYLPTPESLRTSISDTNLRSSTAPSNQRPLLTGNFVPHQSFLRVPQTLYDPNVLDSNLDEIIESEQLDARDSLASDILSRQNMSTCDSPSPSMQSETISRPKTRKSMPKDPQSVESNSKVTNVINGNSRESSKFVNPHFGFDSYDTTSNETQEPPAVCGQVDKTTTNFIDESQNFYVKREEIDLESQGPLPISGNVPPAATQTTRKARHSAKKDESETKASTKRDASVEIAPQQPKRGKQDEQSIPDPSAAPSEQGRRGRGRPRKIKS